MNINPWDRVRIYGKTLNTWTATDERGREYTTQREVAYTEYDAYGAVRCTGTEDIQPNRTDIKNGWAWTWDGKSVNRGGYRRWDERGHIVWRGNTAVLKKVLERKYTDALEIQIRTV